MATPLRKITTLGTSNKKILREQFGYKTIRQAYSDFGVDNADDAYEFLKQLYNNFVETENANKLKQEKIKKAQELKDAQTRDVSVFKINEDNNWIGNFVSFLKQFIGKNLVIDVFSDGERVKNVQVDIPNTIRDFNSWWASSGVFIFLYPDDSAIFPVYPTATLYIYEGKEFNNTQFKKMIQRFRDADNGKCVFNPIRKWAEAKYEHAIEQKNKKSKSIYKKVLDGLTELEDKYPFGVFEEEIGEVCNKLQIDISIEKPLCDKQFITCKSDKKALKHFKYINSRINHIELNEFVKNDKPIIVSRQELLNIKKNLVENNQYHTFNKDSTNISKIQTIDAVYSISNEMQDTFSQFEIDTGLINCKIDDIDDKMLSSFVKWGTHYNGTVDFKNVEEFELNNVMHIDMSKAYSRFKMCKNYEGFLGKITDFRLTNSIQGVGLYYIYDLVIPDGGFKSYNDTLKIYLSHNIYTSAELKFLSSKGCTYKILGGCWGVKPIDFEFSREMIEGKNDDGNSYYALWTGKCDSHRLEKNMWINGDYNMCCLIKEHTTAKIDKYENGEICVKYPKSHNFHLGHITAFITAYQRLNVLEQLEVIDYDNVIRVCVDGIYTETEVSNLKNAFRLKNDIEDKTFRNVAGDYFISNIIEDMDIGKHIYKSFGTEISNVEETIYAWDFGKKREHNGKELHLGAGGNGKTHKNLIDNGLVKLLYVAPSWKLARNKATEYNCNVSVWARLITNDPEMISLVKRFSNVLLIDECSMMTEDEKNKIFELYGDMKIIFCGDLGYQLSSFNGVEMNTNGFDKIIEHNTNYRCKDSRLLALLQELRKMIFEKKSLGQINQFVNSYFVKCNRIITKDILQNLYKVDDMILVGTNELKKQYTELFPSLEKYYCLETNRIHSNGEIVIGSKPECKSELRHAYTTHSIQGETAYHNLYIESSKMFNPRMFYTALSRAKTLDQIYIIEDLSERFDK
jgi:hypothetical protein